MVADIYKPELWNSFFIMVGGGVAALTGLVFVALSIALSLNLEDMTEDATHKYRSINTLAGLTAIFVTCGLVLMPDQSHRVIGLELPRAQSRRSGHFPLRLSSGLQVRVAAEQATIGDRKRALRGRAHRSSGLDFGLDLGTLCGRGCNRRERGLHDFGSMVARGERVQRKKAGVVIAPNLRCRREPLAACEHRRGGSAVFDFPLQHAVDVGPKFRRREGAVLGTEGEVQGG